MPERPPPGEEEALLERARDGDPAALEGFWEMRRAEAFRLALMVTGRTELAEEALQESWMGMREGLKAFDPARGTARGWLLGIVRHKALKAGRALRRRPLSLDLLSLGEAPSSRAEAPDAALLRSEQAAALLEALESLPPEAREAVSCRWILGWDDRTMAEALGISPEAARQRAHRGLLALRAAMVPRE